MKSQEFTRICLNIKKQANLFSAVIEEVLIPLQDEIDFANSSILKEDSCVAFKLKSRRNAVPISLVFWLDSNRVSFFIEDYEILDDYLIIEEDGFYVVRFLRELLGDNVCKRMFVDRNGITKRIEFKYQLFNKEGILTEFKDVVLRKFSFFQKLVESKTEYNPWLK